MLSLQWEDLRPDPGNWRQLFKDEAGSLPPRLEKARKKAARWRKHKSNTASHPCTPSRGRHWDWRWQWREAVWNICQIRPNWASNSVQRIAKKYIQSSNWSYRPTNNNLDISMAGTNPGDNLLGRWSGIAVFIENSVTTDHAEEFWFEVNRNCDDYFVKTSSSTNGSIEVTHIQGTWIKFTDGEGSRNGRASVSKNVQWSIFSHS